MNRRRSNDEETVVFDPREEGRRNNVPDSQEGSSYLLPSSRYYPLPPATVPRNPQTTHHLSYPLQTQPAPHSVRPSQSSNQEYLTYYKPSPPQHAAVSASMALSVASNEFHPQANSKDTSRDPKSRDLAERVPWHLMDPARSRDSSRYLAGSRDSRHIMDPGRSRDPRNVMDSVELRDSRYPKNPRIPLQAESPNYDPDSWSPIAKQVFPDSYSEKRKKDSARDLVFRNINNRYTKEKLQKNLLISTKGGISQFLEYNSHLIVKEAWERIITPSISVTNKATYGTSTVLPSSRVLDSGSSETAKQRSQSGSDSPERNRMMENSQDAQRFPTINLQSVNQIRSILASKQAQDDQTSRVQSPTSPYRDRNSRSPYTKTRNREIGLSAANILSSNYEVVLPPHPGGSRSSEYNDLNLSPPYYRSPEPSPLRSPIESNSRIEPARIVFGSSACDRNSASSLATSSTRANYTENPDMQPVNSNEDDSCRLHEVHSSTDNIMTQLKMLCSTIPNKEQQENPVVHPNIVEKRPGMQDNNPVRNSQRVNLQKSGGVLKVRSVEDMNERPQMSGYNIGKQAQSPVKQSHENKKLAQSHVKQGNMNKPAQNPIKQSASVDNTQVQVSPVVENSNNPSSGPQSDQNLSKNNIVGGDMTQFLGKKKSLPRPAGVPRRSLSDSEGQTPDTAVAKQSITVPSVAKPGNSNQSSTTIVAKKSNINQSNVKVVGQKKSPQKLAKAGTLSALQKPLSEIHQVAEKKKLPQESPKKPTSENNQGAKKIMSPQTQRKAGIVSTPQKHALKPKQTSGSVSAAKDLPVSIGDINEISPKGNTITNNADTVLKNLVGEKFKNSNIGLSKTPTKKDGNKGKGIQKKRIEIWQVVSDVPAHTEREEENETVDSVRSEENEKTYKKHKKHKKEKKKSKDKDRESKKKSIIVGDDEDEEDNIHRSNARKETCTNDPSEKTAKLPHNTDVNDHNRNRHKSSEDTLNDGNPKEPTAKRSKPTDDASEWSNRKRLRTASQGSQDSNIPPSPKKLPQQSPTHQHPTVPKTTPTFPNHNILPVVIKQEFPTGFLSPQDQSQFESFPPLLTPKLEPLSSPPMNRNEPESSRNEPRSKIKFKINQTNSKTSRINPSLSEMPRIKQEVIDEDSYNLDNNEVSKSEHLLEVCPIQGNKQATTPSKMKIPEHLFITKTDTYLEEDSALQDNKHALNVPIFLERLPEQFATSSTKKRKVNISTEETNSPTKLALSTSPMKRKLDITREETNSHPVPNHWQLLHMKSEQNQEEELEKYTKKFLSASNISDNLYESLLKQLKLLEIESFEKEGSYLYRWEVNLRWLMVHILKRTSFCSFLENIECLMSKYPTLDMFFEHLNS